MKKSTLVTIALLLACQPLWIRAQSAGDRSLVLQEYQQAVSSKTSLIRSNPEWLQEAMNAGWFDQIAIGLQNAQNYANGTYIPGGGSTDSPTVGATCSAAEPFCTQTGTTYPAGVNTGNAESGPNYGCLGSQPNPAWYYMKVGTGGDIHITETNSANVDIDFILWGPFTSQNSCTSLTASKIVDCSYSSQAVEYIDITTCAANDYFILLVTNFSNQATNITLTQTSGSGSTDCSILNPTPPAPVAGGASSVTSNSFVANWGASANATGYRLDVALDPGFTNFLPGYNNKDVGNVLSWTVTGLSPGTSYFYRVRAYNANGTSPNSNTIVVTLQATISGPGTICATIVGTYTTQSGMSAYNWSATGGGTITGGQGTNTVTISWASSGAKTVNISYINTTSNAASGSYNVTVNPLPVPSISGPVSICVNTTGNVYTTQTGMTNYIWGISAGGTITGGQGTSSVTVSWNTAGAQSVSVIYTNASGCTANPAGVLNVTVNPLPVPTITGPNPVCQLTTNTYTTQTGMTNYLWTVSAGGTITGGGTPTSNTVTVKWNTVGSQSVSVNYTNANGCTAQSPTSYGITVNPLPSPTINGTYDPCLGQTEHYYTEAGMTNYQWSVTSGATILSGQGTYHIIVHWDSVGVEYLGVNYANAYGCSLPSPYWQQIFVYPMPGAAGAITGTSPVCAGANGVGYSTTPIAEATSYTWTVPSGATIASGAGTTAITVNFGTNASSGNVTVAGTNNCGNGTPSTFAVTVNPLPDKAGTISGAATVCQGDQGVGYSVPVVPNATGYVWTLPPGATIATGANTRAITVNFSNSASSGAITVHGTNGCGNGEESPQFNVTVNQKPPTPVITESGGILTSNAPTGNQWYFNGAAIPGATEQTHEATQSGDYYVIVTLNGCSSDPSNTIQVIIQGISENPGNTLTVYPVPNEGLFSILCTWTDDKVLTLEVYNSLGVMIHSSDIQPVRGKAVKTIDLRPVPGGVYTLILKSKGSQVARKMLVYK